MKILSIAFLCIIGICITAGCNSSNTKTLYGKWLYAGTEADSMSAECTEIIELDASSEYKIVSDCYGNAELDMVIESGTWGFNKHNHVLVLTQRRFYTNYVTYDSSENITLNLKYVSPHRMLLCPNEKTCTDADIFKKTQ